MCGDAANRKIPPIAVFDDVGFGHSEPRGRYAATARKARSVVRRAERQRNKIVQMINGGAPEFRRCQRDIVEQGSRVARKQFQRFGLLWDELHDHIVDIGDDRRKN